MTFAVIIKFNALHVFFLNILSPIEAWGEPSSEHVFMAEAAVNLDLLLSDDRFGSDGSLLSLDFLVLIIFVVVRNLHQSDILSWNQSDPALLLSQDSVVIISRVRPREGIGPAGGLRLSNIVGIGFTRHHNLILLTVVGINHPGDLEVVLVLGSIRVRVGAVGIARVGITGLDVGGPLESSLSITVALLDGLRGESVVRHKELGIKARRLPGVVILVLAQKLGLSRGHVALVGQGIGD